MKTRSSKQNIVAACAATIALAGCGGSGDGTPVANSSMLTVTVIDGAIEGALVCLDVNSNGMCETGEPHGTTDVSGKATFSVANADAGKFPVLAVMGPGAKDADLSGIAMLPYTMKAPKDNPALVTPLTTLVQVQVESTGATTAAAATAVQQQLGIDNSPLLDFTKTGEKKAQSIANAVVVTTQTQADTIKAAKGSQTASGATVTQGDLDKLVAQKVAALLDQLVVKAIENADKGAKARVDALKVAATTILSTDGIKDASSATAAVEQTKQTVVPIPQAVDDAWVGSLRITSAFDYFVDMLTYSAAENTADASGNLKFRYQTFKAYPRANVGSVTQVWSGGWANEPRDEAELHWTGSTWKGCDINAQHVRSAPDAKGNSTFNLCENQYSGSVKANVAEVAGKKIKDVLQSIKDQGYTNVNVADPSKLSSSTFDTGAKLAYYATSPQTTLTPPAYNPGGWDWAYLPDTKLAVGDAASCALSNQPASNPKATLDQLVARVRGTPCINVQATPTGKGGVKLDSGSRNDGWGATTLGLVTLGTAPTYSVVTDASSYYSGNTRLRLAFADGNGVNYYKCQERWDGRPRNCDPIGTGKYTMETLGDAKVMKFSGLPTAFTNVKNWVPVFVERAGYVHYGYQSLPKPGKSARLNAAAANSLLKAMGVSKFINPADTLSLTPPSYAGEYEGTITGTEGTGVAGGTGTFWMQLTPGQSAVCNTYFVAPSNPGGTDTCSNFTLVPRSGDGTIADVSFNPTNDPATKITATINFYTGEVSGGFAGSNASGSWKGTVSGLRN